jgi:hypothetical protein
MTTRRTVPQLRPRGSHRAPRQLTAVVRALGAALAALLLVSGYSVGRNAQDSDEEPSIPEAPPAYPVGPASNRPLTGASE